MSNPNRYYLSPRQRPYVSLIPGDTCPCVQVMLRVPRVQRPSLFGDVMEALIRKHPALRTLCVQEPGMLQPVQELCENAPVGSWSDQQGDQQLALHVMEEARIKVRADRLFNGVIVHQDEQAFVILTLAAYAADLYSLGILCRDITAALAGDALLAGQDDLIYPEFAQWQEELLQQPAPEEKAFWQQYPLSAHQHFNFYVPGGADNKKRCCAHTLPEKITGAIRTGLYGEPAAVLAAAWWTVLAKHHSGREVTMHYLPYDRAFPELDGLVGLVGEALPLSISFNPSQDLQSNIGLVSKAIADLTAYQYTASLAAKTGIPVMFGYIRADLEAWPGAFIERVYTDAGSGDLQLLVIDNAASYTMQFDYNVAAYTPVAANVLYEQWLAVLTAITQTPAARWGDIPMALTPAGAAVTTFGTGDVHEPEHNSLPAAFDEIARLYPAKAAVTYNEKVLTYDELRLLSDQLAQTLAGSYGILPGDRVGVLMDRSVSLIVTLLGIIKAGAAYVPVDPADAPERMRYIISDSQCRLLITAEVAKPDESWSGTPAIALTALLQEKQDTFELPVCSGTDAAYMIYTSGTSGRLKGVPVKHLSLLNYVSWIRQTFGIHAGDAAALMSSHAFDLGYTSLWGALLSGATLHLVPEYLVQSPDILVRYLQSRQVSYLKTTPSFFNLLLKEAATALQQALPGIRLLLLGGEKYRVADLAAAWEMHPSLRIVNHYGPTETTVGVLAHEIMPERLDYYRDHCVIGKPALNTQVLVLNEQLRVCPPGIRGEIYIGGAGLSDGYFRQETYTAERFVRHPELGLLLYRTGDEGCWNIQEELEFIGRLDKQVKINGYRVELSEIEAAARAVTGIQDALVTMTGQQNNELTACYYVAAEELDARWLREQLSARLPVYMIPAVFRRINAIPLTINGKVDYQSLPVITAITGNRSLSAAPRNATEQAIVNVWEEVLGKRPIGIYDNFFQLGGDSIKAIQISSRLHNLGYPVPVREIFSRPEVSALAQVVSPADTQAAMPAFEGVFPLPPVYRYFFGHIRLAPHHYNQSMLLGVGRADMVMLTAAFAVLFEQHDILRLHFQRDAAGAIQAFVRPPGFTAAITHSIAGAKEEISHHAARLQEEIDLFKGPLLKLHLFETPEENLLLIILHHTLTDVVSWNILLDDLNDLLAAAQQGQALPGLLRSTPYGDWATGLAEYATTAHLQEQLAYWQSIPQQLPLPAAMPEGSNRIRDVDSITFSLTAADTALLISRNSSGQTTGILSALLAAMGMALQQVMQVRDALVMLESHGREALDEAQPLHRTMGWFTALYPFYLPFAGAGIRAYADVIGAALAAVPDNGSGYGLLRYMTEAGAQTLQHRPAVRFNYLGNSNTAASSRLVRRVDLPLGLTEDPEEERPFSLDMIAWISDGLFHLHISYSSRQFTAAGMQALADKYENCLLQLVRNILPHKAAESPQPVPVPDLLSQEDLDNFFE